MTKVQVWVLAMAVAVIGATAVASWSAPAAAQCPPTCEAPQKP